ncbi:MAG: HNH endonuclease [Acidimicrobiia bacterium]|nr:HNH endonuclease [Acidimicrobiia bacterium]
MSRIEHIAEQLREVVSGLDAVRLEGRDALQQARFAAEIARLGTTATALLGKRCVDTGVWKTDRSARVSAVTPAEWFADLTDTGFGSARDALKVAEALPDCAPTDRALRSGSLSLTAAREVTAAAAVGGESAEQRVLRTAGREGLRAARDETRRVLAQAPDAAEREARIHRDRARHSWVSRDGIWNLALQGTVALGAELQACLARYDDAAWDIAGRQAVDQRDTPDAIAFDAMLLMARAARRGVQPTSGIKPRGRAKTRDHVVAHIDINPLLTGVARPGERCQIPGVGPVPVEHVRSLRGDAVLTILVEDGRDVRTFARPGRKMVAALHQLLDARDPVCTITGCGRAQRLEHDHAVPVADGGNSTAENTDGLCRHHHRRKSRGWRLVDHHDGTRILDPPGSSTAAGTDTSRRRSDAA